MKQNTMNTKNQKYKINIDTFNYDNDESYIYDKSEWKKLTFSQMKQFVKPLKNHSIFLENPKLLKLTSFCFFYNKKEKAFYYCCDHPFIFNCCSKLNYLISSKEVKNYLIKNWDGVKNEL